MRVNKDCRFSKRDANHPRWQRQSNQNFWDQIKGRARHEDGHGQRGKATETQIAATPSSSFASPFDLT
jgi:hypothetical protein